MQQSSRLRKGRSHQGLYYSQAWKLGWLLTWPQYTQCPLWTCPFPTLNPAILKKTREPKHASTRATGRWISRTWRHHSNYRRDVSQANGARVTLHRLMISCYYFTSESRSSKARKFQPYCLNLRIGTRKHDGSIFTWFYELLLTGTSTAHNEHHHMTWCQCVHFLRMTIVCMRERVCVILHKALL